MQQRKSSLTHTLLGSLAVLALVAVPASSQDFPGSKTLNSGPDPIGTGQATETAYQFTINLDANNFDSTHDLLDTVPAEFDVTLLTPSCGSADAIVKLQRKPECKKQPDHIVWDLDGCDETVAQSLVVDMVTDENPGHCKRDIDFYEPTSCGPLALNDGAVVVDPVSEDETLPSNALVVAACDTDEDIACETNDTDGDNDGWSAPTCGDCDDTDPDVFPGAVEVCNGIDDNCDGQVDEGGVCI